MSTTYHRVGSLHVRVEPPPWLSWIGWLLLAVGIYSMGFMGGVSYMEARPPGHLETSVPASTPIDGVRAASLPAVKPGPGVPMPWATAVRVRVLYDGSQGMGSGTVVRGDSDRAVILTCAHLFRDRSGAYDVPSKWTRPVAVDTYGPEPGPDGAMPRRSTHVAKLIDFDADRDVGLVEIKPGRRLAASPVAPASWRGEVGETLVSVGCSAGSDPTAWAHRLRGGIEGRSYSAVVVVPKPVPGRSGGGLFTLTGTLVGVCNAASVVGPEGLYASPASIRHVVDRNGVELVHGLDTPAPAAADSDPIVPGQAGHRPVKPSPQVEAAPPNPSPASPGAPSAGSWAERNLGISGTEVRLAVVAAIGAWYFRRRRADVDSGVGSPPPPSPSPAPDAPLRPGPADPWDRVMVALEAAAAHDARTKEAARVDAERSALKGEILGKLSALVSPTPAPTASGVRPAS